jgi:hypothetical protein
MSLAMKRLQNVGWIALVFLVAIMLYPLSLNVASVHSDLVAINNKILNTKREISFLQAELRTRANLQQLEEWNNVLYGYQSPTAEQFLDGEAELASLSDGDITNQPVLVAALSDGVKPAGTIDSAITPITQSDQDTNRPNGNEVSNSETKKDDQALPKNGSAEKVTERTAKLASMDKKLLSADVLKDIDKKSQGERKKK